MTETLLMLLTSRMLTMGLRKNAKAAAEAAKMTLTKATRATTRRGKALEVCSEKESSEEKAEAKENLRQGCRRHDGGGGGTFE